MTKGEPHKYHHYVPQCYLRQFAFDAKKKSLHAYSKRNNKQFPVAVDKVCAEKYFYALSDEYLSNNTSEDLNKLSIELDFFAENEECELNLLLSEIEKRKKFCLERNDHDFHLTDTDRLRIARQIAIQYLRLPETREFNNSFHEDFDEKHIRLFKQGLAIQLNKPEIAELPITMKYDEVVSHAESTYMDEQLVSKFANDLANNYWIFYYSNTNSFYTCDSPIFAYGHCDRMLNVRNENLGLTRFGVETTFPLNPSLILGIWDRRYHNWLKWVDGCIFDVTPDFLRHCNLLRTGWAKNYVFSRNNDFDLLKSYLKFAS